MRTLPPQRHTMALAVLWGAVALSVFGCSRREQPSAASDQRQAGEASEAEKQTHIRVDQFFGKYVTTDYAWCSVSPPSPPEAWAKGYLHDEAAILPEVFAVRGVVVLNPRYEIRHYPKLSEGDVPMGVRRRLSDFYGVRPQRAAITRLEVYKPGAAQPRYGVEIIDENTLWETWDGPWLFEWRRDGTGQNPIPLKERALGGVNSDGN